MVVMKILYGRGGGKGDGNDGRGDITDVMEEVV